jgi:hypothetical protein
MLTDRLSRIETLDDVKSQKVKGMGSIPIPGTTPAFTTGFYNYLHEVKRLAPRALSVVLLVFFAADFVVKRHEELGFPRFQRRLHVVCYTQCNHVIESRYAYSQGSIYVANRLEQCQLTIAHRVRVRWKFG